MLDRLSKKSYIVGEQRKALTMNRLPLEKRTQIIGLLVEGNSLRATSRLANVSINTVTKLLADIGTPAKSIMMNMFVMWYRSECNVMKYGHSSMPKIKIFLKNLQGKYGVGSIWTWTALDADSKLMVSWLVGNRDAEYARVFIKDLLHV